MRGCFEPNVKKKILPMVSSQRARSLCDAGCPVNKDELIDSKIEELCDAGGPEREVGAEEFDDIDWKVDRISQRKSSCEQGRCRGVQSGPED